MSTYHIIGEVQHLSTKPNPLNFNRTDINKMTVVDKEGIRYHGTRPYSLVRVKVGDRVVFKAEINASVSVPNWFFFKNPRMAAIKS